MASFSVTISNTVNVFGPAESTKWNAFNWGGANWGEGSDVWTYITKLISESVSSDSTVSPAIRWHKTIDFGSFTASFEMTSENVKNGIWSVVFVAPTSEAESRNLTTWTSGSAQSTSWTSGTVSSVTWS